MGRYLTVPLPFGGRDWLDLMVTSMLYGLTLNFSTVICWQYYIKHCCLYYFVGYLETTSSLQLSVLAMLIKWSIDWLISQRSSKFQHSSVLSYVRILSRVIKVPTLSLQVTNYTVSAIMNKNLLLVSIDVLFYLFRCIMAGSHKFVFLVRGHIVLVAVAYTQESVTQVYCSLHALFCSNK